MMKGSEQVGQNERRLIIGGHDATEKFPYYVSLDYHKAGMFLSGALVAPDIVLTAGHCLPKEDPNSIFNVTACIGTVSLSSDVDGVDNEVFGISMFVRHPQFNEFEQWKCSHDFLILKLSGQSTFPPIAMNRDSAIPVDGQDVFIMGLGWTNATAVSVPKTLQVAELQTMKNSQCANISDPGRYSYKGLIDDTMVCAKGGDKHERDGCAWDSGGPIVIKGDDRGQDLLVALASWGEGCADRVFPSVNARVSGGADWIDSAVCLLSSNPPEDFGCNRGLPFTGSVSSDALLNGSVEASSLNSWVALVVIVLGGGAGLFALLRRRRAKMEARRSEEKARLVDSQQLQYQTTF